MKLEERVAEQVVRAFNLGLSDTERERLTRRITTNSAGYEEYQKGRTAVLRGGQEAVDAAVALSEERCTDPTSPLHRRTWRWPSCGGPGMPVRQKKQAAKGGRAASRPAGSDTRSVAGPDARGARRRVSLLRVRVGGSDRRERSRTDPQPQPRTAPLQPGHRLLHLGLFALSDRAAEAGLRANPRTRAEYIRNRGRSALYDGRFKPRWSSSQRVSGLPTTAHAGCSVKPIIT